ncbi:MAG: hypothetical protein KC643_33820, partial [Nitrospira sp.]|nr:hypothetical protein [Nitrospira sp.]
SLKTPDKRLQVWDVAHPRRKSHIDIAPKRTKDVIEAEEQYHQERKAFEALFEQAKKICWENS